ncbi:unnamed protein product [Schistocephalus solidus]|uniref:Uncharacterized protein n=1 Tax=Schistocephalus solidus TaxID=70667 RepID=A0A183SWB5_SCHSO|nr:unnamed protein product [Schistocephalus solidus]
MFEGELGFYRVPIQIAPTFQLQPTKLFKPDRLENFTRDIVHDIVQKHPANPLPLATVSGKEDSLANIGSQKVSTGVVRYLPLRSRSPVAAAVVHKLFCSDCYLQNDFMRQLYCLLFKVTYSLITRSLQLIGKKSVILVPQVTGFDLQLLQRFLESVSEASFMTFLSAITRSDISVETTPSQLHLPQHGVDGEDSGPSQDFRVLDLVLPSQLQYSAEAAEMKVIVQTIEKDTDEDLPDDVEQRDASVIITELPVPLPFVDDVELRDASVIITELPVPLPFVEEWSRL